MLPVQNRRLYEHQIALAPKGENIVVSLPKGYVLTNYDKKRFDDLEITVVYCPEGFSLGQSVVYVLNVLGRYHETLRILHGDTLFSELTEDLDVCAVAKAEDNYDWDLSNQQDEKVYSGYFAFSDQSFLIQKITEAGYNFVDGVRDYGRAKCLINTMLKNWMDFGLSNSYYRSISKLTTQRVFNSLKITRYSLRKSSTDKRKMLAEANWLSSLPIPMKHYAPSIWDSGEEFDQGYYEIEYYFLSSLASLFTFGKINAGVWEEIIDACLKFLNDESQYKPDDPMRYARQNDKLYSVKTLKRLEDYSKQAVISLDEGWIINGVKTPSLRTIIKDIEPKISKEDSRFATLMHGDPCFSNILYDFKSKSIKVIDPRGLDIDGNISIYGDLRYDVAKLAHSVIGMYDYIIGGMFEYSEISKYNISLSFEMTEELREIQGYFLSRKIGGYTVEELSTYPILIHLFLSMLPLHNDKPDRQKAMLANALRLYVEYNSKKDI